MSTERFFAYARERHTIYLRRQNGAPRDRLTEDKILQTYRFCNVFRELDTTTVWFRENVRDPLRDRPEVLLATVLFRWFNRIRTGEAIFQTTVNFDDTTAFEEMCRTGPSYLSKIAIIVRSHCGQGPYVTGSYIVKTPDKMDKLTGVLWCVERFMTAKKYWPTDNMTWLNVAEFCLDCRGQSLERMWEWLRQHEYLGDFMAYEIVSDLQYTALLDQAPDIMTWANAGPGARRGLNRVFGRDLRATTTKHQQCREMQELLAMSQSGEYWPQVHYGSEDNPSWDMRTVEHTLCEFDKYERVRLGEGAPRQRFRP